MDIIKGFLQVSAPALATALGGPAAGTIISALSRELLGNPNASEEEISQSLTNPTPEQLIKIKEIEKQFLLQQSQINLEEKKLPFQDLQNARDNDVKTIQITGSRDKLKSNWAYITLIINVASLFMIFFLILKNISVQNDLLVLLGAIINNAWTELKIISTFLFGSSDSSQRKDELISTTLKSKK